MSAEKFSASMEDALLAQSRADAEEEGVSLSAWLAEAARDRLRLRGLRRVVAVYEAEHGVITEAEMAAVRAEIEGATSAARP